LNQGVAIEIALGSRKGGVEGKSVARGVRRGERVALTRSNARLAATQALYQWEATGAKPASVIKEFTDFRLGEVVDEVALPPADLKLFTLVVTGAAANVEELDDMIAWGPGPRASQALMLAVRAKAMIEGRLAPSVDDVIELAEPVLKHRMALTFAARAEGVDMSHMVARLVEPLG